MLNDNVTMYWVPLQTPDHALMNMPLKNGLLLQTCWWLLHQFKIQPRWMQHWSCASMQLMPLHRGSFYKETTITSTKTVRTTKMTTRWNNNNNNNMTQQPMTMTTNNNNNNNRDMSTEDNDKTKTQQLTRTTITATNNDIQMPTTTPCLTAAWQSTTTWVMVDNDMTNGRQWYNQWPKMTTMSTMTWQRWWWRDRDSNNRKSMMQWQQQQNNNALVMATVTMTDEDTMATQ